MESQNNEVAKACLNCQKPVRGRSDKKFCTDMCRNDYNNRLNSRDNCIVRTVMAKLLKNRRILKEQLGESKTRTVAREDLMSAGFQMSYLTHRIKSGDNKYQRFCFEYCFEPVEQNKIKISHTKKSS